MPLERCSAPYQINISVLRCCVLSPPSLLSSQKLLPWGCRCFCHRSVDQSVFRGRWVSDQLYCFRGWPWWYKPRKVFKGFAKKNSVKMGNWFMFHWRGKKEEDGGLLSYHREIPVHRWQSTMNNIHSVKLTFFWQMAEISAAKNNKQ